MSEILTSDVPYKPMSPPLRYRGARSRSPTPATSIRSPTLEEPRKAFLQGTLTVVVLGASGNLARTTIYPSLMKLFINHFLPPWVWIVGYGPYASQHEEFHAKLRPWLLSTVPDSEKVDLFLTRCRYFEGSYEELEDFGRLGRELDELESLNVFIVQQLAKPGCANRLFYFAIQSSVALRSASCIKLSAISHKGFNRLVIEKPLGHDLQSAVTINGGLGVLFSEDAVYRIDHYLTQDLIRNLYVFRFGLNFPEHSFNSHYISSVEIIYKECCGTEGHGGYFSRYGIIRDVILNALMQVLSIVAMEPPQQNASEDSGAAIRDAKNDLFGCIEPINPTEVIIGQYVAADGEPGYLDDDTIEDFEEAKRVPTFAALVIRINNPRWAGVPFILQAGKALSETTTEVRIRLKPPYVSEDFFDAQFCKENDVVVQLCSEDLASAESVETGTLGETDIECKAGNEEMPLDPYTRLVLEALRGVQGNFVHIDELFSCWKIIDPLLVALEQTQKRLPIPYDYGSTGPPAAQLLFILANPNGKKGYVQRSVTEGLQDDLWKFQKRGKQEAAGPEHQSQRNAYAKVDTGLNRGKRETSVQRSPATATRSASGSPSRSLIPATALRPPSPLSTRRETKLMRSRAQAPPFVFRSRSAEIPNMSAGLPKASGSETSRGPEPAVVAVSPQISRRVSPFVATEVPERVVTSHYRGREAPVIGNEPVGSGLQVHAERMLITSSPPPSPQSSQRGRTFLTPSSSGVPTGATVPSTDGNMRRRRMTEPQGFHAAHMLGAVTTPVTTPGSSVSVAPGQIQNTFYRSNSGEVRTDAPSAQDAGTAIRAYYLQRFKALQIQPIATTRRS